ncbi:MAG: VacB/RNase II family 3'-5' exoribonuclease [Kiritimatiellae bacterium]|nr:VacB/RNase II family 3'-5' exoribonuclease [Kiritimatiellia bacterium]
MEHLLNRLFREPGYRPLTRPEIARRLRLDAEHRRELRATLKRMQSEGAAVELRKNRWAATGASHVFRGRVWIHRRGTAQVEPEDPQRPTLALDAESLRGAIHGDTVEAEAQGRSEGGARGRIVRVMARRFAIIPGLYKHTKYYDYVIPTDARMPTTLRVRGREAGLDPRENELVALALDPWSAHQDVPGGTIIRTLGVEPGPDADIQALMLLYGLQDDFPEAARAEAAAAPALPRPEDLAGRRDFRDVPCVTIDPENARDFDDAVTLRALPGGRWELGVHIADVSHLVPLGGPVDMEARSRATSVYLADRFIPMLPRRLTAEVCSLRPHVDRLGHSVLITLSPELAVESEDTAPTVIRSRACLNYDQVQALIAGQSDLGIPEDLQPMLRDMNRVAERLRRRRMAAGALDFTLPEIRFEFNDEGRVETIRRRGGDEAYHLIEEFMLLANQAVARRLSVARVPAMYRIHEEPDEDQWDRMEQDLAELGFTLRTRSRQRLNEIVRQSSANDAGYAVALAILRNLKRAEYSPRCVPHFGLAFHPYTHFTSPIRRYPDLVVHRMLKAIERDAPPPLSHTTVAELAEHCSRREREADEAERESVDIKRLAFFQQKLEEGETGPFHAVVTMELGKGWIVELWDSLQRALIPRSFVRGPGRTLAPGTRLDVQIMRVDPIRRLVDVRPWPTQHAAARNRKPVVRRNRREIRKAARKNPRRKR